MSADVISLRDASSTPRNFAVDNNSGVLTPYHQPVIGGTAVSSTNPLPTSTSGKAITITQTVVNLSSTDTQIIAANANRKYLAIANIDTGLANLGFGSAAVAGQGWPLAAAAAAGDQGGALIWEGNGITQQAIHGICASGVTTSVVVLEGI